MATGLSEHRNKLHQMLWPTAENAAEVPGDFRYEASDGEFGTGVATTACRNRADVPFSPTQRKNDELRKVYSGMSGMCGGVSGMSVRNGHGRQQQ